jgi:hypothetical protein
MLGMGSLCGRRAWMLLLYGPPGWTAGLHDSNLSRPDWIESRSPSITLANVRS